MANNPDGMDEWNRDFTWNNGRAVRFDKWGTPREVEVIGPNGNPVTLTQSMYYAAQGNVVEAPNSGARGYSPSMPTSPANPVAGYTQNADGSFSKPGTEQDPAKQSGFLILKQTLEQWGLGDLVTDAERLWKEGLDAPAVTVQLSQTASYKQRFAGNEARTKKGLRVLSPAEYIANETAYATVLRQYGLPASFYDSRDDFTGFIGSDVSPDELNDRASIAQTVWLSTDDNTKSAWREFYGLSDGAAIASILDPDKALPLIERMANAARFGGLAKANGLEADKTRLERYADLGLSQDTIAAGFTKIGQTREADDRIGARFGQKITQADEEAALIEGNAQQRNRLNSLYASEGALFESRAAAESGALSRTSTGRF